MTRTYAIFTAIALSLIAGAIYTVFLLHEGAKGATTAQAVAQTNHSKKVKKDYDQIDKVTPYGGSSADVSAFLLAHTRDR